MGIGDDIKEVIAEVGTAFTIVRDSGEITGEYLSFEMNSQVTKPFIREYFLEALFAYDSAVRGGDVIRFDDNRKFLVMNATPDHFENAAIDKEVVLYKCNVSGELRRPVENRVSLSYRDRTTWSTVRAQTYGLIAEKLFGTDLMQDEPIGQIPIVGLFLYVPSRYGVRPLDRYHAKSGEYYKIETVKSRDFDGVDTCSLVEDTRE